MAKEKRCPQCGAELPVNAPGGVCPKCVIKLGLPTGADPEKPPMQDAQGAIPTSATPPGGFVPPEPAELEKTLPALEVIELLGQGGMGAVYKARQKQLDRFVALKILPPEVGKDPAFAERFTREARSLAKLNHPHIVTLYEFGRSDDDLYYFIMEFVDGTDLRHVINAGELGADEALAVVPQICEALQYAHEEGVVHRDIKPENILLDKKGCVKIGDFGLAKLLDRPVSAYTLTQAGQKMGTPHYMAPEQIEGAHKVDHRADIYSLGVVFYEMLTGQLPIGRFDPPSQKVQVDVRLDKVVLKSLEYEPKRRYQHASEVQNDVESIAVGVAPPQPSGQKDTVENEPLEQCVLSRLPATRIEAVKAYQEKTGAGRTEAVLAVDAIVRKYGVEFVPVPLKLRRLLTLAPIIGIYVVYILFRRHVEISSALGWSLMGLACVSFFIFFSVAAWRSRSIDKGLQFRFVAGFFLFLFVLNPLLILLLEPMLILNRLYSLTGGRPGLHDVLFLRIVIGAIFVVGLYWLLRLWLKFRTNRRTAAGLNPSPSSKATDSKPSNRVLIIAVIAIVVIVFSVLVSLAIMYTVVPSRPFYDRLSPVTRTGTSGPESETTPMKIGGLDMPFGTWSYVEFGPAGPVLTGECVETLDLKPSELLAVNEVIQGAYKEYLELEEAHTNRQRNGDILKVTITPFREQALPILEQLWADLDNILDTRKQGVARRHLPLGRIFAVLEFEFGGPTVNFTFEKEGRAYNYEITRDWPEGSGKSDGGRSGRALTLPAEYQRFWDEPVTNE